jgi:hypothetical protein
LELEEHVSLHPDSVDVVLADLHSILSLPPEGQTIQFRNRTIRDYLISRERGGDMYLELYTDDLNRGLSGECLNSCLWAHQPPCPELALRCKDGELRNVSGCFCRFSCQ